MRLVGWVGVLVVWVILLSASRSVAQDAGIERVPALPLDRATVELHAHLFMKEGMTWFFRGHFDEPLQATDWTQRLSNQTNPESLNRSDIGIVVAALYSNPFFVINQRDSIRRQIKLAQQFVAHHPEWALAKSPTEARAALIQSKRVLVLSLEGAADIIETEQDLREFVDEGGIRIVTLIHLIDDLFGGSAFQEGYKVLSTPWAWFTQLFSPVRDPSGVRINANGLTEKGRALTEALIKRHVWVDLPHASDRAQEALFPLLAKAGQPLLYTHTALRKYMGAERGITTEQLERVRKSEGVVGLMPATDMLVGTVPERKFCGPCTAPCEGGLPALAQQYSEVARILKPEQIALGSDYNGGIRHLPPPPCPLGTELDTQGLWNIGLEGAVWDSLEKLGLPVPTPRRLMVDHFLAAWERVERGG
jgi:microsomal dipeptidase-like Zn-dependent dipeptidase